MGTIQDDIKELREILIQQNAAKEKKFKYPFGKKVGKSQKKKNFVTLIMANDNGLIDYKKYQIIDQTIIHDMIPRLATAGHVMHDKKGNPVIFLPTWSVEPFSPSTHFKNSIANGSNTNGYRILMNRMESEKIDSKPKMGGMIKWIIGLALGGIIIYAILSGGGA